MENNIINQYSSAFIEVINEEQVNQDKVFNEICELKLALSENTEYLDLLNSINISSNTKKQLIDELIGVNKYIKNLLCYMIDKNDQHLLLQILRSIIHDLSKTLNIINVKITSAFELSKDEVDKICKKISNKLNKKVIPELIIDKTYIAGISIEYDSKIIDNSIKAKLDEIRSNIK